MKLFRFIPKKSSDAGCVAAIGNFDGVHRGHQHLLALLRSQSERMKLPLAVILFEPQPREFFMKQDAPPRLSRLREKIQQLSELGVDDVYCLRFNQKLALMPAHEFAEQIIFKGLQVKYLLVGRDFRFGRDRLGNIELLTELGQQQGVVVQICPDFSVEAERVSSTQVREALQLADFARVESLLGRPYSLCGRVMYGHARGRQWGVPTANLKITQQTLPLSGVFCVQVRRYSEPPSLCCGQTSAENASAKSPSSALRAHSPRSQREGAKEDVLWEQRWAGVANLGKRPTLDGVTQILEVHLFDMNETLYGERLEVFFLHKLRDEVKFSSLDDLIAQIHTDVLMAKNYFLSE